jgi:hypothetical protein
MLAFAPRPNCRIPGSVVNSPYFMRAAVALFYEGSCSALGEVKGVRETIGSMH